MLLPDVGGCCPYKACPKNLSALLFSPPLSLQTLESAVQAGWEWESQVTQWRRQTIFLRRAAVAPRFRPSVLRLTSLIWMSRRVKITRSIRGKEGGNGCLFALIRSREG